MADQRAEDGALPKGVQAIESTYADLQGHFSRLEGDLSTIGSSWQGAASVQFTQLMQQWQDNARKINEALQENARKVNEALQELADKLRGTHQSMEAKESDTESSFSQLLGGL